VVFFSIFQKLGLNKIREVMDCKPDFMEVIGNNSLEIVKKEYNWDKIVCEIEQLYKEVLKKD
jgi:glycosyltransferase involved in cell wall biosynthesis